MRKKMEEVMKMRAMTSPRRRHEVLHPTRCICAFKLARIQTKIQSGLRQVAHLLQVSRRSISLFSKGTGVHEPCRTLHPRRIRLKSMSMKNIDTLHGK